jgi:hypothetical protein
MHQKRSDVPATFRPPVVCGHELIQVGRPGSDEWEMNIPRKELWKKWRKNLDYIKCGRAPTSTSAPIVMAPEDVDMDHT